MKKRDLIEPLLDFLGDDDLGLFGAGHLASAIATVLLRAGLPAGKLLLCHGGSPATTAALRASDLASAVTTAEEVVRRSKLLLYLVRPQDAAVVGRYTLRPDCCFVSFLAAVPLERLPFGRVPAGRAVRDRCRMLTSAPDTLLAGSGIAASYPAGHPTVARLVEAMGLRPVALRRESDFHAFTALGPCLPICLAYWESLGRPIDDGALLALGERCGLRDYEELYGWALAARPRGLAPREMQEYLARSATRGGVTEAMLAAIDDGAPLLSALERGISRSRAIAAELEK